MGISFKGWLSCNGHVSACVDWLGLGAGFDFVPGERHDDLRLLFAYHATQFHGAMPICVVRLCVGFSDKVIHDLLPSCFVQSQERMK
jgi:hypothetical protein